MTSIDEVFTSNTLKAADIQGREVTVTIETVTQREFKGRDGQPQNKLVVTFRRASKAFVCNKTNAQRIAYIHGKDYSKWVGKQITLFVDPFVQFGNELTPAIRVKPPTAPLASPSGPQSPEEIDPMPDNTFANGQSQARPAPRKPLATYQNSDPLAEDFDDAVPF